ncbi:DNA primase [Candidatus Riesia pediculicola]|uniref:DNA primase n=1 Tax=Candidatus Riesia pediculicola TaxID=401619 RepID=UPI0009C2EE6D|nr:DNA primase [Candidatus Riesia pediculicola]ARC54451.1 hypothetical protein AOE57_02650 [Candidatus Riesia pediculicola]
MLKNKKISNEFVKELIEITDIVELIQNNISLQEKGKNYVALCPFHKEKTPSFTVNKEKRFYYCFGCSSHGNSIDFLMNYKGVGFVEAIKELSEMNGLEIVYEELNNFSKRENFKRIFYGILHEINKTFIDSWKYSFSYSAKRYLQRRGLDQNTIQHFSIGFGSIFDDKIKKKIIQMKNYSHHLKEIGIIKINEKGRILNKFHNRITFPIRNRRGIIVAFGGRTILNNHIQPKYINSPESVIFKKGKILYGMYEVIKEQNHPSKLLVVEGYMDVISLKQFQINYAVAILGTSLTENHVKTIFKFTNSVIFCFDGDQAGYSAAWRTLKIIVSYMEDDRQARFMFLPNGYDPDKIIREEGKEKFEKRIEKSHLLSYFLFNRFKKKIDLSNNEGKARFSTLVSPIIYKIPGYVFKRCMFNELSHIIGVSIQDRSIKKPLKSTIQKKSPKIKKLGNQSRTISILIKLLIKNPNFVRYFPNFNISKYENIKLFGVKLFLKIFNICRNYPEIDSNQLEKRFNNDVLFKKLKEDSENHNFFLEKKIERRIFQDAMFHLTSIAVNERFNFLISKERKIGLNIKEKEEVLRITSRK